MRTSDDIIGRILRREGGYVDHPDDPGGCTKYGITRATLERWRGEEVLCGDVQDLSRAEAREIYRRDYIEAPRFDEIPDDGLQGLVVDCGVNHGTDRATRWLQRALGLTEDGIVGPVTRDALRRTAPLPVYRAILAQRIRFYGAIVSNDPSQLDFLEGWLARATEFLDAYPGEA
jgi:lysozyme family protein